MWRVPSGACDQADKRGPQRAAADAIEYPRNLRRLLTVTRPSFSLLCAAYCSAMTAASRGGTLTETC
jgi:hypothetical protein